MLNISLLWLLLIPITCSLATFLLLPLIAKVDYKTSAFWSIGGLFISALIMIGAFHLGKGIKTGDHELWNGQITAKTREHGSYQRSYDCNCVTTRDSNGNSSTRCQTCYEDHYTVHWRAASTIGGFEIASLDWTSRRVYDEPNPAAYTRIRIGEPCAKIKSYTNYIKAVPESLFRPASTEIKASFANMIPGYPIALYDKWKVNRVLPVKTSVPNIGEWNEKLSEALKTLGPMKQANIIILLVNSADPNYAYAIQDAWLNGKKNDIILIIGTTNFPNKADWVSVLALTDAEIFKIKLRDDVMALENLSADNVITALTNNTIHHFTRKSMKDFAYLDAEIDPPEWVTYTTSIMIVLAYLGFLGFVIHDTSRVGFRRTFRNIRF